MANLTIRNIDASVTTRLQLRAAQHGRSMEDEARQILQQAVLPPPSGPEGLGSRIHRRFLALAGIELEVLNWSGNRAQLRRNSLTPYTLLALHQKHAHCLAKRRNNL